MKYYEGLKYHMEEALAEIGNSAGCATNNPTIAKFSKKYYNEIEKLSHEKIYDYVFIGSIHEYNKENREWIIDFAKKYFTKNSVFINTTADVLWVPLGSFDYTGKIKGTCPDIDYKDNQSKKSQYREIEENKYYFETMCQSKFCLCPAGDAPWSFRFYEVLMCKSIPIVESWFHTFRTDEESNLGYKYVLYNEPHIFDEKIIEENSLIFERNHLFPVVHFFTYATDLSKAQNLKISSGHFKIDMICVTSNEWKGYHDKIINLCEHIKKLPSNDIVCFIDSYDSFINESNKQVILDKFLDYDCELLFGAELNCFPDNKDIKKEIDEIPCLTKYRYINSGGYIGYVDAIKLFFYWKSDDEIKDICEKGTDQLYFTKYFLEFKDTRKIKLDYKQAIFQNMYKVPWNDVRIKNRHFYNYKLDTYPCFVHFSGSSDITKYSKRSIIPILLEKIKNGEDYIINKIQGQEPISQL